MTRQFFTVGHSTRSLHELVELLKPLEITLVIDVRTVPRSRTNPQFNSVEFASALSEFQIQYEHVAALGGLRGKRRDMRADVNGLWRNESFHNYADYATSDDFRIALAKLRALGHARTSVIMCAEAVWWRCHRRIIADYLIAAGETVLHIIGRNHIEPARLTDGARLGPNGAVFYPPASDIIPSETLATKG
jgi:uncharacterized protein (DUF488 family)